MCDSCMSRCMTLRQPTCPEGHLMPCAALETYIFCKPDSAEAHWSNNCLQHGRYGCSTTSVARSCHCHLTLPQGMWPYSLNWLQPAGIFLMTSWKVTWEANCGQGPGSQLFHAHAAAGSPTECGGRKSTSNQTIPSDVQPVSSAAA